MHLTIAMPPLPIGEVTAGDLADPVSQYIGETEKHMDRALGQAAGAGAMLQMDEADALFGNRTEVRDAHGQYAGTAAPEGSSDGDLLRQFRETEVFPYPPRS
jgi:hypothetical protein